MYLKITKRDHKWVNSSISTLPFTLVLSGIGCHSFSGGGGGGRVRGGSTSTIGMASVCSVFSYSTENIS